MKKQVRVREAIVHQHIERRNLIIALIILVVLLAGLFYYFAYPRVNFDVETWYAEGFLGSVSIDVTVRNNAPTSLDRATLKITLLDSNATVLAATSRSNFTIGPWETFSIPSLYVSGSEMGNNTHFDTFTIIVDFSFMANKGQEHTFQYTTAGNYMNLFFSDSVGRFPF